ncbi:hypothetical protein AAFF_G00205900 [Aldrovandia affinis]|uniref:Uncharacterized protein n=1 Tax=Aldrovandia affinis TaxID=143900 RepID=A0AAD7RI43_9TELE|nr:hypothetical protein AAFF_G00205900 [Aldrovandia affinis]
MRLMAPPPFTAQLPPNASQHRPAGLIYIHPDRRPPNRSSNSRPVPGAQLARALVWRGVAAVATTTTRQRTHLSTLSSCPLIELPPARGEQTQGTAGGQERGLHMRKYARRRR